MNPKTDESQEISLYIQQGGVDKDKNIKKLTPFCRNLLTRDLYSKIELRQLDSYNE